MAEGKRVVNGEGEGFVMMRFPGTAYADHMGLLQPFSLHTDLDCLVRRCCPGSWQNYIKQVGIPYWTIFPADWMEPQLHNPQGSFLQSSSSCLCMDMLALTL